MRRILAWAGWPTYWLAVLIAYIVISGFVIKSANAHDWYINTGCCYGEGEKRDCENIPAESVQRVEGGYIVTLTKAQMLSIRPMLRGQKAFEALPESGIREFFPRDKAKVPPDGLYSACLKPGTWMVGSGTVTGTDTTWILCFFDPGLMGS